MSLYKLSDAELNLAIKLTVRELKKKIQIPSSVKTLEKYMSLESKLKHERKQRKLLTDMQRCKMIDLQQRKQAND